MARTPTAENGPPGALAGTLLDALQEEGWKPWLFFPRGHDWRWLSRAEALAAVGLWATELAVSDEPLDLLLEARAPEAFLLALTTRLSGGSSQLAEADHDSWEQRLEWRGTKRAATPKLSIGYSVVAPLADVSQRGTGSFSATHDEGPQSREPRASLLLGLEYAVRVAGSEGEDVLSLADVLLLEPSSRALLSSLYWLRPAAVVLAAEDARTLEEQLAKPRRPQRRLCRRLTEVFVLGEWGSAGEALPAGAPVFRQL